MAGLGMGGSRSYFEDASPAIQRRRHLSGASGHSGRGEQCRREKPVAVRTLRGFPIRPGSKTLISAKSRAEDFPGLLCETAQRASG